MQVAIIDTVLPAKCSQVSNDKLPTRLFTRNNPISRPWVVIFLATLSHPLSCDFLLLLSHFVRVNADLLLFLHQAVFPGCFSAWCATNVFPSRLEMAAGKFLQLGAWPPNFIFTFSQLDRQINPRLLQVFMPPALILKVAEAELLPNR
jgi:hypothetical protein